MYICFPVHGDLTINFYFSKNEKEWTISLGHLVLAAELKEKIFIQSRTYRASHYPNDFLGPG